VNNDLANALGEMRAEILEAVRAHLLEKWATKGRTLTAAHKAKISAALKRKSKPVTGSHIVGKEKTPQERASTERAQSARIRQDHANYINTKKDTHSQLRRGTRVNKASQRSLYAGNKPGTVFRDPTNRGIGLSVRKLGSQSTDSLGRRQVKYKTFSADRPTANSKWREPIAGMTIDKPELNGMASYRPTPPRPKLKTKKTTA